MKNIKNLLVGMSILVFTLGVGCGEDAQCQEDRDCFAGETCMAGQCGIGERNNTSTNNTSTNNTSTNNTSTNNTSTNNTSTNNTSTNNTSNNTSTNNTSTNNASNNTSTNNGVCAGDVFDVCDDPKDVLRGQNTWSDADRSADSAGCVREEDTIVERSPTVEGIICPRDPADWYAQTIVGCRTKPLTIEVRVTPTPACAPEEWVLVMNRAGARVECGDPRITCSEDGVTKVVRWVMPAGREVESWYFGIENVTPESKFEYTATMTIR